MNYQLRISSPGMSELLLRLQAPGPWRVGSSTDCQIPLRARGVSREHLEIAVKADGTLYYCDLQSTNGTFLNGLRAMEGKLPVGAVLSAGEAVLRVEDAATEALHHDLTLENMKVVSLMEIRPEQCNRLLHPGPAGFGLPEAAMLLDQFIQKPPGGAQWEALCRLFADTLGCLGAKCYSVQDDRLSLHATVGRFPDERVPPRLAQACALLPRAATFEKLDPGAGPLTLISLPLKLENSRAVFLGNLQSGGDPLRHSAETVLTLAVLFQLFLTWAGELKTRSETVAALHEKVRQLKSSRDPAAATLEPILGKSPALLAALEQADRAAGTDATVLLCGETGTGKELFARRIHNLSSRSEGPFLAINCAAIPEQLLESELFGAKKGAYTGCDRDRPGQIERAASGTLFLDEIADMPLALQPKLLRVLEEGVFRPIGGGAARPVQVRFIAATNQDLSNLRRSGRFRQDLYFRLATLIIEIPPLRERQDDILPLARAFLEYSNREFGCRLLGLEEEAVRALQDYNWPGNVRELLAVVKRLVLNARYSTITGELAARTLGKIRPGAGGLSPGPWDQPWKDALATFEREYFSRRLAAHDGSMSGLAREVGIARPNLYLKLKKLGLEGNEQ